jgi:hypothetical protein
MCPKIRYDRKSTVFSRNILELNKTQSGGSWSMRYLAAGAWGNAWIDGCSLAGGQQHAACMRRVMLMLLHARDEMLWSRASYPSRRASYALVVFFVAHDNVPEQEQCKTPMKVSSSHITYPGYVLYVRHAGFWSDRWIDGWHCWHAALQGRAGQGRALVDRPH